MKKNQKGKPMLTISLLSSGRMDTIRKCLDSLHVLRERVPSELIIVDTGHDEAVLQILQEYTDKIIPFTWCNDFSKARNAGLEKAQGEWFMFLDDDEWFIDTTEIEEFFLSGTYHDYGYAHYIVRNFYKEDESVYKDNSASRMFKLNPDTRFVSSIHEHHFPITGNGKYLHSIVKHFGYMFRNEEEKVRHNKRNLILLQDMLKKERTEIRWWVQLVQEYRGIKEYTKMKESCEKALAIFEDIETEEVNVGRGTFYNAILAAQQISYDYEAAETFFKKAISDKRNTLLCQAALYSIGADIYFHEKDYAGCRECCEKYLEIYEKLKDDENAIFAQGYFFVNEAFDCQNMNRVYSLLISSGLYLDDTAPLKEYFTFLGWEEKILYLEDSLVTDIIDAMGRLPYDPAFTGMVEAMLNRNGIDEIIITRLKSKESEPEVFDRLSRIFLQITSSHPYVVSLHILLGRELTDMAAVLEKISFDEWKAGVDCFCENASKESIDQKCSMLSDMEEDDNVCYAYLGVKLAEAEVISRTKDTADSGIKDYVQFRSAIEYFIQKCLAFYEKFFKENAFTGDMELLPSMGRIAVRLKELLSLEKGADIEHMSQTLKACLGVYPAFDPVINVYTQLYAAQEKKRLAEDRKNQQMENLVVSTQMQQLGAQIKDKIRILLKQGMAAEALQTLNQLKPLLPDDPELEMLEAEIRRQ